MSDNNEDEEMEASMMEFLGTFTTVSSETLASCSSLSELHDGVVLFEALSEM
jgi:hypothetical protein